MPARYIVIQVKIKTKSLAALTDMALKQKGKGKKKGSPGHLIRKAVDQFVKKNAP